MIKNINNYMLNKHNIKIRIFFLTTVVLSLFCPAFSQTTVLRHIEEDWELTKYELYGSILGYPLWGYTTGHNGLSFFEWAEKYELSDTAEVTGVISHHWGTSNSTTKEVAFFVYLPGGGGYPGFLKTWQFVTHDMLNQDGTATVTYFDDPTTISSDFFISFQVADYICYPNELQDDTLVLLTSYDGTRPDEDLSVSNRNVTREHLGNPGEFLWHDLYSEMAFGDYDFGLKYYLALYPIVTFSNNVDDPYIKNDGVIFRRVFPNPAVDILHLSYEVPEVMDVAFLLTDRSGREIIIKEEPGLDPGTHESDIDLQDVSSGTYIIMLMADNRIVMAQQVEVIR